jgi:response regulator RpfG family c-di-GMP phosphodiesterase
MDKFSVLIVEQNSITRKLMRVVLESAGYGVFEAPNGEAGVRLIRDKSPDLVLQDLHLSEMDELELVKELRRSLRHRDIPICFFKPVEPSRLLQVITKYCTTPLAIAHQTKEKFNVFLLDGDPMELKPERLAWEAQGFELATCRNGKKGGEKDRQFSTDAALHGLMGPRLRGLDLRVPIRPLVISSSTDAYINAKYPRLGEKVGSNAFGVGRPNLKKGVEALGVASNLPSYRYPVLHSQMLEENDL